MDEQDFLARMNWLTQSPTLEGRFKQLLDATRDFFHLDACSLLFVPDSGADFHLVSQRAGVDQVHEEHAQYVSSGRLPMAPADLFGASGMRALPRRKGDVGVFTRDFRVESVAGADFRPQQNLEVRLRLTRSQVHGKFSEHEVQLIAQLIESIRGAIENATREKYATLFNGYAQKLLACLRVGIFIVTPRMEILQASPLADELLERLRSYRRNDRWLAGAAEEFQARLDHAVYELNTDNQLQYRVVDIITMGRGEQYPLVVAKAPALPPAFTENNFVVFIFSSAEDLLSVDRLLSLWQISPAEKRVLVAIARYDNIKKVALELNISPNTAKAQLKSIYKKLGVGSKMRLMKRLNILRNVEALMS